MRHRLPSVTDEVVDPIGAVAGWVQHAANVGERDGGMLIITGLLSTLGFIEAGHFQTLNPSLWQRRRSNVFSQMNL